MPRQYIAALSTSPIGKFLTSGPDWREICRMKTLRYLVPLPSVPFHTVKAEFARIILRPRHRLTYRCGAGLFYTSIRKWLQSAFLYHCLVLTHHVFCFVFRGFQQSYKAASANAEQEHIILHHTRTMTVVHMVCQNNLTILPRHPEQFKRCMLPPAVESAFIYNAPSLLQTCTQKKKVCFLNFFVIAGTNKMPAFMPSNASILNAGSVKTKAA